MFRAAALLLFILVDLPSHAQNKADDWTTLLDRRQFDKAETLCRPWLSDENPSKRVEADKCLANVVLAKGQIINLLGNDTGGGSLGEGYKPEAVKEAIVYLDAGLALAPQDLSLHLGRLHILEVTGAFDEMMRALQSSLSLYKGGDAAAQFLQYAPELGQMGQAKAGLEFCGILDQQFPDNHEIIGNIGAFHNMLGEHEAALPYLQRAVALAPKDSMDAWNFGWSLKDLDRASEADLWLSRSLQLDAGGQTMPERNCLYARFVGKYLHDRARSCRLERKSCAPAEREACSTARRKH